MVLTTVTFVLPPSKLEVLPATPPIATAALCFRRLLSGGKETPSRTRDHARIQNDLRYRLLVNSHRDRDSITHRPKMQKAQSNHLLDMISKEMNRFRLPALYVAALQILRLPACMRRAFQDLRSRSFVGAAKGRKWGWKWWHIT